MGLVITIPVVFFYKSEVISKSKVKNILVGTLVEIGKLNLEFKWKCEGTRAARTIMKESKNDGRFHTLILRLIFIKTI